MDPFTIGALLVAGKLGQKLFGGSSSSPSTPASATSCRWCGDPISGAFKITQCCRNTLCQSCTPDWQRAGGKNCVFCGKTHG